MATTKRQLGDDMSKIDSIKENIQADITKHPLILYMKGTRLTPQCGFSAQVVKILNSLQIPYETRDILQDNDLRQAIKEFSDWPTIPQLYVNGEFIGGCDIITELHEKGELRKQLNSIVK